MAAFFVFSPTVPGAIGFVPALWVVVAMGVILVWRYFSFDGLLADTKIIYFGVLLFLVPAILSLVWTDNYDFGMWRLEKYTIALLTLLILAMGKRVQSDQIKYLLVALVCGSLAVMVFSIGHGDSGPHGDRVGLGEYLNPNRFGAISFGYALLLICGFAYVRDIRFKLLLAGAFCAAIFGGFASGSRGALLGFVLALPLCLPVLYSARWKKVLLILVGVGVVSISIGAAVISASETWRRSIGVIGSQVTEWHAQTSGANETSVGIRLELWRGALMLWRDAPILGVGIGDVEDDMQGLIETGQLGVKKSYARLHGMYFDALASTGLFGFIGMIVGVFVLPLMFAYRVVARAPADQTAQFARAAISAWVAYHVLLGLTSSWVFNKGGLVYFVVLMVLVSLACQSFNNRSYQTMDGIR
ncbi:MAG: O-antigen ligase family protein [Pseudomonadota bacterium]